MYPVESFRETIVRIVEILRRLSVRFHLTGGAAAIAFGEPRMTQDVDLVVDRTGLIDRREEFLRELRTSGFLFDRQSVIEALDSPRMFQVLDAEAVMKIDIYPRELIEGELTRSVDVEVLPGLELPVVSRADLAIAKLIWIEAGSHKSRRDLRMLIRGANEAESTAVRVAADARSLGALLDEVLAESDEIDR